MAYTPTKWQDHIPEVQDGTPVSAVNMNKIEEGIMQAHQVADSTASALDHAYHPLFHITPQGDRRQHEHNLLHG